MPEIKKGKEKHNKLSEICFKSFQEVIRLAWAERGSLDKTRFAIHG